MSALIEVEPATQPAAYETLREAVGLADLSGRGRLELTGADRVRFLNNLCTNDIAKLPVGAGCEAFCLDVKGRALGYLRVYALPESLWLDLDPGVAEPVATYLDRYLIREDVTISDRSASHAQLHLAGPKAPLLLSEAIGFPTPDLVDQFHMARTIGDVECQIRRCDRSPRVGFDLVMPLESAAAVRDALVATAEKLGLPLAGLGPELLNVLRIEAGIPVYGLDIDDRTIPQEVGRDVRAISFTKGCYLGQETVARLDAMGHVNKLLRGVTLDATGTAESLPTSAAVLLDGKDMGRLTSLAFSPALGKVIGLGILRIKAKPAGTAVTVRLEETDSESIGVPGTVCDLPFDVTAG